MRGDLLVVVSSWRGQISRACTDHGVQYMLGSAVHKEVLVGKQTRNMVVLQGTMVLMELHTSRQLR